MKKEERPRRAAKLIGEPQASQSLPSNRAPKPLPGETLPSMAPKTKTAAKEPELPEIVLVGYGAMKGKTLKAFIVSEDYPNITLRVPNPSKPAESKDYEYDASTGRVADADPKKGMEISAADLEQFQPDEDEDEDEDEEDEEDEDEDEFEVPEVGEEVSFEKDEEELTGIVTKVNEDAETCDIKVGKKTYKAVPFDDLLADEEETEEEDEEESEDEEEEDELVPEVGDDVIIKVAGKEVDGVVASIDEDEETADVKVGKKTHKGIAWDDISYPDAEEEEDEDEDEEEEEEVPEPPKRGRGRPPKTPAAATTETPAKKPLAGAAAAAAAKKASGEGAAPKAGPNEIELRVPDGMYSVLMSQEVTKKKPKDDNHAAMQAALTNAKHAKWWHGIFNLSASQGLVDAFMRNEATWAAGGVAGAGMVRAAVRLKTEMQEKFGKKLTIPTAEAAAKKPLPTKPSVAKPAAPAASSKSGLPARSGRRTRR